MPNKQILDINITLTTKSQFIYVVVFFKSKYNYFSKVIFNFFFFFFELKEKCHAGTTGLISLLSVTSILTVNKPFIFEDTEHLGSEQ